jgi:hypothetical protein
MRNITLQIKHIIPYQSDQLNLYIIMLTLMLKGEMKFNKRQMVKLRPEKGPPYYQN